MSVQDSNSGNDITREDCVVAVDNCSVPILTPAEIDSQSDTGDETSSSSSSSTSSCGLLSSSNSKDEEWEDPYADVRDRMEALAWQDKNRAAMSIEHRKQEEEIPFFVSWTTYLGYAVLIFVGHIRDKLAGLFGKGRYLREGCQPSDDLSKYAPLLKSWENFYTRRLYHRIQDCFNRPIASNPGAKIQMLERISHDGNKTMQVLGQLETVRDTKDQKLYSEGKYFHRLKNDGRVTRTCFNLGSYNYLGFADDWQQTCRTEVMEALHTLPISSTSPRMEFGATHVHAELEASVAHFLGKPAAITMNMGYNTNVTTIPALVSSGDLIISDELNHTSIVSGARASGAAIRLFNHNNTENLEQVLRQAIVMGQPRTRRPWNKILVIVEGIYSMEGEYCDLPGIVKVTKKHGAYLYLDEAHSFGAFGATGRGCCEYTGVDPKDVDILMGTFTKSLGGMGGYVASSTEVIDYLRNKAAASSYHNSLSPTVCQQVITSLKVVMGKDGTNIGKQKLAAIRDNSNYFRMKLNEMGLHVMGHYDSPIMPVMLYNPTKVGAFSRECLKRGLAVVVVGFPAVPILTSRARFCISAGHNRVELDRALVELEEVADILKIRYSRSITG
uniref:serine C-palmitoyltransferase n=1 Tax=Eucampia antarctica TaxID=49252 RepID=A0A7S2WH78_9STRA|mmetsp:Transcript_30500/g.29389  ORF Transcript_30500/g.29389 Transcript_30500/m.29389 type:complete len:614 (+) Transcript_30500:86-1927(+)|eukprot:CAMPEP_0197835808 /NCGR_PEP_ID=MMETSP1437-20131217/26982_1 /TAXON_ID=49252 ORGANISM="Eucampia antarctica, Strain CCMP1452" /NCGR_SAMPLE_ID=MMETSP1437 /ASSEMBLY_ACC=CAM_ASM_001096 /LENGTH=613 /DNA_ID=CAMNT_0043441505 /DNA_START=139 /DNA_END=1980 /DNA_ORIENTATION=-